MDRSARARIGNRALFLRMIYFHKMVRDGEYPNANSIVRQFGVSRRTADRDVAFYRAKLRSPILYDRHQKGYYHIRKYSLEDALINLLVKKIKRRKRK